MDKTLKRFLISGFLGSWRQERKEESQTVFLTREETHHLKNVLRMKERSMCLLFDQEGNEFVSRLERFLPDGRSEARLIEPVVSSSENLLQLTVAQAIPQDRKMDEIVRKAAELGIFELVPLITERTVVRISQGQMEKVHRRWGRIVEQTLKQSRLSKSPLIASVVSFDRLCRRFSDYDETFLLHPSSGAKPIREHDCIKKKETPRRFLLMLGPEGGFSPQEVSHAKTEGAQVVKMGVGILKTDTAFVAATSFFQLMYS